MGLLLTKDKAQALKASPPTQRGELPLGAVEPRPQREDHPPEPPDTGPAPKPKPGQTPAPQTQTKTLRLVGSIPPEVWNRLRTKLLPKLRQAVPPGGQGSHLKVSVDLSVTVNPDVAESLTRDLSQILEDLGLLDKVRIDAQ